MEAREGERVTVRVSSREPVRAKLVAESPPGPAIDVADLDSALTRDDSGTLVAASRYGEELTVTRLGQIVGDCRQNGKPEYTVAFGAPERGLPAILGVDADDAGDHGDDGRFDLWLNTVPNQGSEVVRTEEAMFATLACLTLTE
jgi:predicted SPOUT superfamily RNA methylase MTH1